MERVVCHLLPFAIRSGCYNMAADEVMLDRVGPGAACLRFYGWEEPTISLGYFQKSSLRHAREEWSTLPFVRRPTGGGMLLHHHELTYALALPLKEKPSRWLERMHGVIADALRQEQIDVTSVESPCRTADEPLCFHQHTPGDILCRGAKVVGSAQRKRGNALLQHGAVLLARSTLAPSLSGIMESVDRTVEPLSLAAAIAASFLQRTGWDVRARDWTREERTAIETLIADRYSRPSWNERRE